MRVIITLQKINGNLIIYQVLTNYEMTITSYCNNYGHTIESTQHCTRCFVFYLPWIKMSKALSQSPLDLP